MKAIRPSSYSNANFRLPSARLGPTNIEQVSRSPYNPHSQTNYQTQDRMHQEGRSDTIYPRFDAENHRIGHTSSFAPFTKVRLGFSKSNVSVQNTVVTLIYSCHL